MSSSKLRKMCADAIFFSSLYLGIALCRDFGLQLSDLVGAIAAVVILLIVSEVFYSLFLARTNDSLAEEIVSGKFDCEK